MTEPTPAEVRAETLREAADLIGEIEKETVVNVAVYPVWDERQKMALAVAARKLRRMAEGEGR